MEIAVIGAGVTGLTTAYELCKKGAHVTVFEKDAKPGGQLQTFPLGGERLENFYHHIFRSDKEVINLLRALELGHILQWIPSRVGFYHAGSIYNFITPGDLLRFKPLSIFNRIRLGLASLYLQRQKNWTKLEPWTAREWIIKYAGTQSYEVIWGPLLKSKFGDKAGDIGMAWLWGRMYVRLGSRSKGMQQEMLGYLQGSYGLMVDALIKNIQNRGGKINLSSKVESINIEDGKLKGLATPEKSYHFDGIVATVPSDSFIGMCPDLPVEYVNKLRNATYQAAQCLVLVTNKQLTPFYWLNISDESVPFLAVIEHTNFIDPRIYGGKHIIYLSNYLNQDSPWFHASKEEMIKRYVPYLRKFNRDFSENWIESSFLFKELSAQPVVPVNYSRLIPEHRTPVSFLYLGNTTQIYPEDRGINYSIRMGIKLSSLVAGDMLDKKSELH